MSEQTTDRNGSICNIKHVVKSAITGQDLAAEQAEAIRELVLGRELSPGGYKTVLGVLLGRLDFAQSAARTETEAALNLIERELEIETDDSDEPTPPEEYGLALALVAKGQARAALALEAMTIERQGKVEANSREDIDIEEHRLLATQYEKRLAAHHGRDEDDIAYTFKLAA